MNERNEYAICRAALAAFTRVVDLTQVVRQGDPEGEDFKNSLGRLRIGQTNLRVWELFRSQIISPLDKEEHKKFENAIYFMPTDAKVNAYNSAKLADSCRQKGERICGFVE